jgi:hypothetical protein
MLTTNTQVQQDERPSAIKVLVYRFTHLNPITGESYISGMYATESAIEHFKGRIIVDSAIEVDRADLDGYGRYHPVHNLKLRASSRSGAQELH